MIAAPTLLSGCLNKTSMTWLIVAVMVTLPFESMAYDHPLSFTSLPVRLAVMVTILVALRTERIDPIQAGRYFLGFGLACMVFWSLLVDSQPDRVALEAAAYGTILSILTLLIAPRRQRRQWSIAVIVIVLIPAVVRLLPGDALLLAQACAVLIVHSAAVAVLDVHTNKAEQAGELALLDPLTGLYNRRPTVETLANCISDRENSDVVSSAVVLDLDYFKVINDTHGHEAGDVALREVGAVLSNEVRPIDTISRWGGEEFLVVLHGVPERAAAETAERLRAAVESSGVTASFGVAEVERGDTPATWVRRADEAMYDSKRGGRNRVTVASAIGLVVEHDAPIVAGAERP